ncbi:MAG: leucyl aminopeptidase [Porticoccaceae bacterium]
MEFAARLADAATFKTDCLIVLISGKTLSPEAKAIDAATGGMLSHLRTTGDMTGASDSFCWLHKPAGIAAKRLLLMGVGDKPLSRQALIKQLSAAAKEVLKTPVRNAAGLFSELTLAKADGKQGKKTAAKNAIPDATWIGTQVAQQFGEAQYKFEAGKTTVSHRGKLGKVTTLCDDAKTLKAVRTGNALGAAIAAGSNVTRLLGDLPANVCTPGHLAKQARALGRKHPKVATKVLSEKQMAELGMHSLLSVTAGTELPAYLITMEYKGGKAGQKPVVLVGKGVTFDSGGISLKPGGKMDEMKYDMCGAASVFGVMEALVAAQLPINVVAIVPTVENMPSGTATRPGDVVKSMSGQTIEILNTDAEGRLILCDALTYAARFKPDTVIDIATLTGACVVALGSHATGLFSNDQALADDLLSAGIAAGDRAWQLPLWEEYDKQLKSNFADMANIGGGGGGSATAAAFLGRFTKDYTWAHLDIAGTAWSSGPKGATGRPVPLLMEYLRSKAL